VSIKVLVLTKYTDVILIDYKVSLVDSTRGNKLAGQTYEWARFDQKQEHDSQHVLSWLVQNSKALYEAFPKHLGGSSRAEGKYCSRINGRPSILYSKSSL
jgi:hypothetical protein